MFLIGSKNRTLYFKNLMVLPKTGSVKKYFFGSSSAINSVGPRLAVILSLVVIALLAFNGTVIGSSKKTANFLRLEFMPGRHSTEPDAEYGRYFLSFKEGIEARIGREGSIPLFYVDILGARIDANPFLMNFPNGPARLVRLNQTSRNPDVVRATFFLRQNLKPEVKTGDRSLEISFSPTSQAIETKKRQAFSLIPPGKAAAIPEKKAVFEPLNIVVKDTTPEEIFRELARRSGKSIYFRDPVKSPGQLNITANDPQSAMREIANKVGAVITEEDGDIWVSTTQNPLLKLSSTDMVRQADLSNLALGDVLRALGQIAELNIIIDHSLEKVKDEPLNIYLQKTSVRRAFETILKVNNLVFSPVDDKTMLIMTASESRSLEGKVVRVVPVQVPWEKLSNLARQALSGDMLSRVTIQEDLGNLIITGDREAVDNAQIVLASVENKLLHAGESVAREFFHPVNTKAEDIIKLVTDALAANENFKITHDTRTDMLVISGAPTSVSKAAEMLKKLDKIPTRQALIHIRLVEIHRSDLAGMGIRFPDKLAAFNDIAKANASTIIVPAEFSAFNESAKIKTLANPTLRCMDKEESTIDISEQIPVKSTVTDYLPVASASLAARTSDVWTTSEIGIKLKVKPQIHHDGEISMEVNVDQTELVSMVEGHPWTAKRQINTRVRVKDKETVAIGGLIRNKKDTKKRPVPLLSKIPLIRDLVRRVEHRNESEEKTEMVILITPTIVNSFDQHQRLTLSESIDSINESSQKNASKH